jgi:hypothetical protein
MFDLILKIVLLWLLSDVVILATVWYLSTTIQPLFPTWWRGVVADEPPRRKKI